MNNRFKNIYEYKTIYLYAFLVCLLIVLSVVSILIGVKNINFYNLFNKTESNDLIIILASRIPRLIAVVLTGIGMSVCGVIMQSISQNKFVSPTTAGTIDSSRLGILVSILLFPTGGAFNKMIISFFITLVLTSLFMKILEKVRIKNIIFIPLVGIMFGNVVNSISYFFAYKNNLVQNMGSWLMGDFSSILRGRYELIYLTIPLIIITYMYANKFTVAGVGEDFCKNIGLSYKQVVNTGLIIISLVSSAVVIIVGTIPFLGLIIPNIISIIFGDNIRKTLPLTALSGAVFLLICDILGRIVIFPYEVPIGITVSIIGGIIFLVLLLLREKVRYE